MLTFNAMLLRSPYMGSGRQTLTGESTDLGKVTIFTCNFFTPLVTATGATCIWEDENAISPSFVQRGPTVNASDNNVAFAYNGEANFAQFQLDAVDPGPEKLNFEIGCKYIYHEVYPPNQDFIRGWCPPISDPGAAYVQAIQIRLVGPEARNYSVRYKASNWWRNLHDTTGGQNPADPQVVSNGEWAGILQDVHGQYCWINGLWVWLNRR